MDTSDRDHRFTMINDWLYVVIVGALALYLIIGVIAWSWMLLTDVTAPAAFTTVLSTIAGGLIGILAPLGPRDGKRST